MSEEMTAQQWAGAILNVRYEEQGYMPLRDLLVIEITAAEERGKQSAVLSRRHDWISGIADGSHTWHCSTCYVTHSIENEIEQCPAMVALPTEWADAGQWQEENEILCRLLDSEMAKVTKLMKHFNLSEMDIAADPIPDRCEWADLGELTGEALRERLKARAHRWRMSAGLLVKYIHDGAGYCLPELDADIQMLIDLIR